MGNVLVIEFEKLILRIEELEQKVANERQRTNILTNQIDYILKEKNKQAEELATQKQIDALLNLGIDLPVKLTKHEASILIGEALKKKEEKRFPNSMQNDNPTSNPQTKDLYDEEEAYL